MDSKAALKAHSLKVSVLVIRGSSYDRLTQAHAKAHVKTKKRAVRNEKRALRRLVVECFLVMLHCTAVLFFSLRTAHFGVTFWHIYPFLRLA